MSDQLDRIKQLVSHRKTKREKPKPRPGRCQRIEVQILNGAKQEPCEGDSKQCSRAASFEVWWTYDPAEDAEGEYLNLCTECAQSFVNKKLAGQ